MTICLSECLHPPFDLAVCVLKLLFECHDKNRLTGRRPDAAAPMRRQRSAGAVRG